jgi:hypothetical protein
VSLSEWVSRNQEKQCDSFANVEHEAASFVVRLQILKRSLLFGSWHGRCVPKYKTVRVVR